MRHAMRGGTKTDRKNPERGVEESLGRAPPEDGEEGDGDGDCGQDGHGQAQPARRHDASGLRRSRAERDAEIRQLRERVQDAFEDDRSEEGGEGERELAGQNRGPQDFAGAGRKDGVGGEPDGRRAVGGPPGNSTHRPEDPDPAQRAEREGRQRDREARRDPARRRRADRGGDLREMDAGEEEREETQRQDHRGQRLEPGGREKSPHRVTPITGSEARDRTRVAGLRRAASRSGAHCPLFNTLRLPFA